MDLAAFGKELFNYEALQYLDIFHEIHSQHAHMIGLLNIAQQ
jgi:hypothetical protein